MGKWLSILISMTVLVTTAKAVEPVTAESVIRNDHNLTGVESLYTPKLTDIVVKTALDTDDFSSMKAPISVVCIQNPSRPLYIGLKQTMKVNAPLAKVQAVMDDINGYTELFPGYREIKITEKNGNNLATFWEQIVPVPFVSNVKYEMNYRLLDLPNAERLYRYQLRKTSTLTASDGFILLRALSPTVTLYTEYDFFDAEWGAAKMFGERKIWFDSIEGLAQSDVAAKLRAENSDWSNKKARSKSGSLVTNQQIDSCYRHRTTLDDAIGRVEILDEKSP